MLSLTGRNGQEIQSTLAKQLALYVVIYSPIQMAADLPEHYAQHMDAFRFIEDVPTDWDRTLVPNGEVGDYATIVRKDRNSDDWYLGSVTDENARTLEVKLDFLEPGRRYEAQVYRDGDGADWHGDARFRFVRETHTVVAGDSLTLQARAGRRRGDPVWRSDPRGDGGDVQPEPADRTPAIGPRHDLLRHRRRLLEPERWGIRGSSTAWRSANARPTPIPARNWPGKRHRAA